MTLGYIAAFDEHNAMAIINSKGIPPLKDALAKEPEDHIQAAAAWTLGQLGGHSNQHAKAMAEADVPSHLLAVFCFFSKNRFTKWAIAAKISKKKLKRH